MTEPHQLQPELLLFLGTSIPPTWLSHTLGLAGVSG